MLWGGGRRTDEEGVKGRCRGTKGQRRERGYGQIERDKRTKGEGRQMRKRIKTVERDKGGGGGGDEKEHKDRWRGTKGRGGGDRRKKRIEM